MTPDSENDSAVDAASFRDPAGFIFRAGGQVYRQINRGHEAAYRHLMESGLYEKLIAQNLLISHEVAPLANAFTEAAAVVLKPEQLSFVSYPYEWCFGQLKRAAAATLQVQELALEHGMILKDGSAYNIQFPRGTPVLIDTLSFDIYREGQCWDGYGQFCRHFLAPLALMHYTDIRLGQLLRVHLDGVPLDLAARLLPFRSRFNLQLLSHIRLHALGQKHFAGRQVRPQEQKMKKFSLLALIDSLKSAVDGLTWEPSGTEWGNYYRQTNYSPDAFSAKCGLVQNYLKLVNPRTVWDLGGNDGTFSRLAAANGIPAVCLDADPAAVELNFRQVLQNKETNLLPLLLDLTNPSPAAGWANSERKSLAQRGPADVVMALALVHHLAIGQNVPFGVIAEYLHSLCHQLIIEFVPKHDTQVERLLASRTDIFPDYHQKKFEQDFGKWFAIREQEQIQDSERVLYLMERKEAVI